MTFSILVFDPVTNSFGGASATGNICVGAWVLRAEPFSGVSASQGADPSTLWGENVLRYSNKGMSAEDAITKTIQEDSGKDRRQISLIDKSGNGSVFSGMKNSPIIDEIVSENIVLSGNILSNKNHRKILETVVKNPRVFVRIWEGVLPIRKNSHQNSSFCWNF